MSAPARRRVAAVAGMGALVAAVAVSIWIAVGAAGDAYLLHLPGGAAPGWIEGPLHGHGTISPGGLTVALLILVVAYGVALSCAPAIPQRIALAAVAIAIGSFTLAPTIVSSDVFGYVAYAREAVAHGLNPYVSAPIAAAGDPILPYVYWKHETSPYGSLFTALSLPLGLVSGAVALWGYKLLAGLSALALTLLVAGIARRRGGDPVRAAILVGLNPALLFYAVSGAHNDLLAVLLAITGVAFALAGRERIGAGLAVGAAAIKLTLGLALPFLLIGAQRRREATVSALSIALVVGAVSLIAFGPHLLDQLHRIASESRFDIAFSGPDRLATLLGTPIDASVRAISTGLAVAVAAAMVVFAARGGDVMLAAGWAFLALIASIASLAPWYLVWLLPLAALARSRALTLATVLATAYLLAVHLPGFGGHPWLSAPARSTIIAASSAR